VLKSKTLRLLIFALVACLSVLMAVDLTLAGMYVYALTHPGCSSSFHLENTPDPQDVWLKTEDGLAIRAWFYPSQNGAAVLSLGGVGGSLGGNLPPVSALLDAGYGVLQIEGRACAQPPRAVTLGGDELLDAQAGLEFLMHRDDVDTKRIGAFGFSMGGVTALRLAARQPQIRAVVAEGGYDQLGTHITQPRAQLSLPREIFLYTVAGSFWLQTGINPWSISPLAEIPEIAPRPVMLIYGEHEIQRGGGDLQYQAAGEPKTLWVVPGGDHGSNFLLDPQEYNRRVLEFFERALYP
jgi:uncharacterized protein